MYICHMDMTIKQITNGQVKQIAGAVAEKFELVNRVNYFNIINKKTRQCSIEGGRKNLTFGTFYNLIEYTYLQLINENCLYFDWQTNGVDQANQRKQYVYKIQYKVVEILCGYQYKMGA